MSKTGMASRALVLGITLAVLPAPAQAGDGEEEPAGTSSDQAGGGEPDAPAAIEGPWMEGVPAEAQKAAREIFLQGNVLIRDTLFAKAAAKYKDAIALWKHPAFYFNLAIA